MPSRTIYVGRPTLWGNPFTTHRWGHARSVILHKSWLEGRLGAMSLERMGFCPSEIEALDRKRTLTFQRFPAHQARTGLPEAEDEDFLPCMMALWWWMRPWPSGAPHITELARQGMAQRGRWLIRPFYTAKRNAA